MEGMMHIKKTKLDKKSKGFAGLPSLVIDLNLNLGLREKKGSFFAIKNGILYQFERKTSREMIDRFKIGQISALDMKIENNQNTIRMIYKKFYVLLTVENQTLCQKWLNSLKYV